MSFFVRIGDGDKWINREVLSYISLEYPSSAKSQDMYRCQYFEVNSEQPIVTRHDTLEAAREEIARVIGVTDL